MTDETKNDGRFKPGQSGNPKGRAVGSRPKILAALDAIGEGSVEEIVRKQIEMAKDGDAAAAKTILDRVWPPRKGSRLQFDLPEIAKVEDVPGAVAAINRQVAEGELTPDEGALIGSLLEGHRKALEIGELAARVAALEERLGEK